MDESTFQAETVRIPSASSTCAATLYRPTGSDRFSPCVVMGAGGTLTQLDGIPDYARRFASAGIVALTVERTAARAPRGKLLRYPIDHFGCFWPEHIDEVAGDQIDFLQRHLFKS